MFDFIVRFITEHGYLAVFALMAAENIFPPIPSELIMPLAGFTAASGKLSLFAVLLAGTAGSVAGSAPWYYAGRLYGRKRLRALAGKHGRWLTVGPDDIDKALQAFERHGRKAVLFGRLVPAVRTLISVPAGIAAMSLPRYLAYSAIGSLIWSCLLAGAGYLLEAQYDTVARYLDPVSKAIVGFLTATYLYRLATYKKESA
ncbi:DedA family protein [Noviherbaspirillum sp. 1P10PC]|uniref:DedA family protein n=1 Tax=Noviherbaspirillum sp. 1P10PC TaxID=3132292 RepID=UPI00399EFF20